MTSRQDQATAFSAHDHRHCAGSVLDAADRLARDGALRLTPVRRRTLEILLEQHRALGAYEVLERLALDGFGKQPPVAYRALEFLVEHGFAHRIRRLNAFTACLHPGEAHSPAFFICSTCGALAEAHDASFGAALQGAADRIGFAIDRMNIELLGTCPACQSVAGG